MHGLSMIRGSARRILCRRTKRAPIFVLGCSSKGEILETAIALRQDSAKTSRNYKLPGRCAYFLAASLGPLHRAGIRAPHLPLFSPLLGAFAPRTNSPANVRTADSPHAEFRANTDARLRRRPSRKSVRPSPPQCAAVH